MKKWIAQNKNKLCYLLAFLMPAALMLLLSVLFGFYPFGRLSVLVADLRYQFVDYYGYMKNIFFGNDTYFYSFSKTFGGDMAGFASYYLNNPFALLLLFFPNDKLPAGILFMVILLIGFSGLNFNLLINKVYGTRWASLIFSTAYAFMGYFMAYINCTIYFFNIMLLPLIMLGLYGIVKTGKKNYLYVITLFLSMFSNYYMGYMTCLFSALFFLYLFLVRHQTIKEMRQYGKTIFIYIGSSVLAAGLSAFSLCAVVFSLQGQKSSGLSLSFSRNFNFIDVFSGLYTTAFHGNISDGLPIIYSGVVAVVFLLLFFTNKKISFKEKLLSAGILLVMLFSFWIDAVNVVWHGFNHPIGFPYRNSYLFSFFLLFVAYKGFLCMRDGLRSCHCVLCFAVFAIYSAYLFFTNSPYVGKTQILITGTVFALTLVGVRAFYYKKEYTIPIIAGFFMLQTGDLLCNGYLSVDAYFPDRDKEFESYSIDAFADFVDDTTEIVEDLEKEDPGFYRVEKMYRRTHNDAMLIGYNGLSHFSSCETSQVKEFMGNMGFRNNGNWAFYGEGSTAFADCFMGLKYLLSQYDETAKPYEQKAVYGDKYVYQNPYALALAFATTSSIETISAEPLDHFEYQNEIAGSFSGKQHEIYEPVKLEKISLVNVEQKDHSYQKIDSEKEAYIEYQLLAESGDFIYMFFNAPAVQDTTIFVNDLEKSSYFSTYGWSIRETGYFNPGEAVNVRIYLNQDEIIIDGYEFYYERKEALANWYEDASRTVCSINKESSSYLTGTVDASPDAELLVFSIPYEKDWKVKIDGKTIETKRVLDGLLAADITPGHHTIEMTYVPKGLLIGLPISAAAFLILVGLLVYDGKKKYL